MQFINRYIHNQYVRNNIALAWPLALNALLMQSMLMIDTLLVSPLGEIPLAAMGIATTIVAFIMGIQMALANGSQLVMSRAVGSKNALALTKSCWSGMSINFSVALVFWSVLLLFEESIVALITQDVALQAEVLRYLSVAKYVVLFNAVTQVCIALFNSLGKTKIAFKGYLIELPINAVLSYAFIYGTAFTPELGVVGAAVGSLVAIFVRFIYLALCVSTLDNISLKLALNIHEALINARKHFMEIFPVAANVTMLSIGVSVYQLLYSQLSINAYVAITLVLPWMRAGGQFITAWAHSSAISISQAIGSKKLHDLEDNVNISINLAVAISLMTMGFFFILSFWIADIYPDMADETYQALAIIAPIYIILPLVRGYNTVHGHVLRAMGHTTAVFKINFTGQWLISIPLCALLILYFDASIFWAFAIQPFEEIIKAFPFRFLARKAVKEFSHHDAEKLSY
ncbi:MULTISPECIES: MATE family efflux transporter [Shewanella]|uniref:Polysaccharide biosynthesis C-terminal domain-containing protein n=1 Tax=Shewanella electrodiphila TaxID=934143 RepID=A0ABT0KSQ5_9GAMM|nr:MATE family efflux transporter [Shewanella electrodiphila]MCL1046689.1 polysaccharide biosynthesis C-terminal domain-containing protein [Shewanella electrodiphila]